MRLLGRRSSLIDKTRHAIALFACSENQRLSGTWLGRLTKKLLVTEAGFKKLFVPITYACSASSAKQNERRPKVRQLLFTNPTQGLHSKRKISRVLTAGKHVFIMSAVLS